MKAEEYIEQLETEWGLESMAAHGGDPFVDEANLRRKMLVRLVERVQQEAYEKAAKVAQYHIKLAGMTKEEYFMNAMSREDFVEYVTSSENHHEEFSKDVRRIFSESCSLKAYETLQAVAAAIRNLAKEGE